MLPAMAPQQYGAGPTDPYGYHPQQAQQAPPRPFMLHDQTGHPAGPGGYPGPGAYHSPQHHRMGQSGRAVVVGILCLQCHRFAVKDDQ